MPTVEDSDKKDTIEKSDDSKKAESGDDASVVSGDLGTYRIINIFRFSEFSIKIREIIF